MGKKSILFLLTLIFFTGLSLTLHTQTAEAKTLTGSCGKNAVWKYNDKTKVLEITGKGALTKRIKLKNKEVKEIIVGEGITAISSRVVFEQSHSGHGLERLVLPDSLEKISVRAFAGLRFINKTITLPENVKTIEPGAFWGANYLEEIKVSEKNKYFVSKDGVLFSKDYKTLICYPEEKKTENYKIPETVTEIKPMAFALNFYIQKVHLPEGLRKLGGGAFYACLKLSDINLTRQSKITEITDYDGRKAGQHSAIISEYELLYDYDSYITLLEKEPQTEEPAYYHFGTFEGTSLKSVEIPDGVKYLPSKTFQSLDWYDPDDEYTSGPRLEEITLGKNFIGEINTGDGLYSEDSFYLAQNYYWLKSIKVAKGNPKYMVKNNILYSKDGKTLYQAFSGAQKKNLIIGSKVKRIANGAFFRMQGIKKVTVKGKLDSIGLLAFAGCSMKKFTAKKDIQKIGAGAFTECKQLIEFDCKKNVHSIGKNAFASCYKLETVQLGRKLSYLGKEAFSGCITLKEITLAGNLKEIPDRAFDGCSKLKKITFPDNVSFAQHAFAFCDSLTKVVKTPVTFYWGKQYLKRVV